MVAGFQKYRPTPAQKQPPALVGPITSEVRLIALIRAENDPAGIKTHLWQSGVQPKGVVRNPGQGG